MPPLFVGYLSRWSYSVASNDIASEEALFKFLVSPAQRRAGHALLPDLEKFELIIAFHGTRDRCEPLDCPLP